MDHPTAVCAITNPTVDSFKRINGAPTLCGATWSPNAISYTGKRLPANLLDALRAPHTHISSWERTNAG
jgi:glutamine synthetase